MRGDTEVGGRWRGVGAARLSIRALLRRAAAVVLVVAVATSRIGAQATPTESEATTYTVGRFTVLAFSRDRRFAQSILDAAQANDSFPGLQRPRFAVVIALAPDDAHFREWVGEGAPEWGEAIAFPRAQRIVMRGRDAVAEGGDPVVTLRHELAHLALYEALGPGVPRWFDEGYASWAAGEWGRAEILAASFGLVWRGLPTLAGLDSGFYRGEGTAQRAYALSHRAVAELASIDPERGIGLLFENWQREGTFERALRRAHGMSTADFEKHWRSRIRRQYGALALAADLSVLAFALLILLGPLWWQRRARTWARLERMREADRVQAERDRASALDALLGDSGSDASEENRIKGS